MTALKFFKGALPQGLTLEAGMIWFDTANNVIKVYNNDSAWEEYCGNIQVKDVKFANNILTITPREGNATTLDFTDVASAKETMAVFTKLQESITALQTADSNTNTRIDELTANMPDGQKTIVSYVAAEIAKVDTESAAAGVAEDLAEEVQRATAKEAELAQAIKDAEAYTDEVVGKFAAEGVEASGLRKEIAERDAQTLADAKEYVDEVVGSYAEGETPATGLRSEIAGVDAKVDALGGRVADVETAITGEGGLDSRLDALEGLFSGNEGEGVQAMIDNSIETAITNLGGEKTGDGTYVDVKVTTKGGQVDSVVVTEDFSTITNAITAEAERADAAEKANANAIAAEKARIDTLVGAKDDNGNFVDANKSVREIAAEKVAEIVAGADESYDTLKEIADWIAAHPTDVAAMNEAIQKNANDIKTLNDEVVANEETVAAALTDLDTRVEALEGQDVYVKNTVDQQIADALTDANDYTDQEIAKVNGVIGVKEGEGAPSGLYKEISDAAAAAKSEAVTAAGLATDQKIIDLKLDKTYEKVGVAEELVNDLKADLEKGEGMFWALFA